MGCKKRAVASLAVASLLAVGTGFANFALADTATVNQEQSSKTTEQLSSVKAGFGSWATTVDATCADVQNIINSVEQSGAIRITESCAANLVIPSGKTIYLTLYSEQVPEQTPEETPEQSPVEGVAQAYSESVESPDETNEETPDQTPEEDPKPTHLYLINDGSDTITVEEGAVLYYEGSANTNEYLANDNNNGSSVINNHGTTYILTGTIRAVNEAYTLTNDGEINLLGGDYVDNSFRNNNGKIRIAGGTFDNTEELQSYIVDGYELDTETKTVVSILSDENNPLDVYHNALITMSDKKLPVGYSFETKTDYPEYADAMEALFTSSDESIVEVTGSNSEGWTFTVVGAGQASLTYHAIYRNGEIEISSYQIEVDIPNGTYDLTEYLLDNFSAAIQQAIENKQTISVKLESSKLDDADVEDSQKTQIAGLIGEDKVARYYNIALILNGDETKLDDIIDLGEQTIEIRLSTDFANDLEAVAEGHTRSYYVVRVHGGVAEKLDTEFNDEELVFRSGKFSTYAIVYADTETTTPPSEDDDPGTTTPGDNTGTGDDDPGITPGDNTGDPNTTNPGDSSNTDSDNNSNSNSSNNNNNSNSSTDNNQNPSTSTTKPSSNGSNSNKPNSGIGVPNTGVISYYLENNEARIALIIMLVAASVVSSLITAAIVSRKRRK